MGLWVEGLGLNPKPLSARNLCSREMESSRKRERERDERREKREWRVRETQRQR
jgi:hypothetical protein